MTSISGNGASQAIYLDMSGVDIIWSKTDAPTNFFTISSWPVTITNSASPIGPSSILRVVAINNLTLSNTYGDISGNFITGSSYITFDGSGNTITISSVSLYPGFIRNGTSSVNGFANVVVQNFTTAMTSSTLADSAGWLCQSYFGRGVTGISITGCTNFAAVNATDAGGIVGLAAGRAGGSLTITNCANTATISSANAGGITGSSAAFSGGSITITSCTNTGDISGTSTGGILGYGAGNTFGLVTIINCYSTGLISGQYAGGIAGVRFAYSTSKNCVIRGCYSTGAISGNNAGGIVGAKVGYSNNALYTGSVDISNCYSLGNIATTCGGICGGYATPAYTNKANIRISNCYSFGTLTGTGAGLVGVALTSTHINLTATNTYVAAGAWTDASANANLTGTPTNINTNNPGTTWTMITAGTPYVLSAYNAALYSPSRVSSFTNYTSAEGLFQSGYTYQILYSSQTSNVFTAYVFASKGSATSYNSYNFNTFTLTNLNGGLGTPISATINASNGVVDIILPHACFLEGTKILCFENNEEVYRPIESIQKGDLVKTIYNGYVPVCVMGASSIYNPGNDYRVANRIYKCPREKYPTLFEDLYITGCHSILVPQMTNDQWENTKAVNKNIYVTDNHFRLIACADEKAEPFNKEGFMNIYHVALDHHDICMNYGIYANGLLVESCSIEYLIKYSNLKILGEEDCVVSEGGNKVLSRQLVDTY